VIGKDIDARPSSFLLGRAPRERKSRKNSSAQFEMGLAKDLRREKEKRGPCSITVRGVYTKLANNRRAPNKEVSEA